MAARQQQSVPHPEVTPVDALKSAAEILSATPEWRPFPVDLMPKTVRDYVLDVSSGLAVDPAMTAVPMISVLAGLVGTKVHLNMDPNAAKPWLIRPIFWTATVAYSGSSKTPAWEAADDLAQLVERKLRADNEMALSQWEQDVQAWKDEDAADRGPRPVKPVEKRLVVDDATVEGIGLILADNPNGLLLSTDELRNWVDTFTRYRKSGGGGDASRWLPFHGGKRFVVDRKGGDRPSIYVPHAAVSVTGTIQPGILARIIGDEERESGFFARMLLAMPPGRPRLWRPSKGDKPTGSRMVVEEMAFKLFARQDGEVRLDPRAQSAFMAWQHAWATDSYLMASPDLVAFRTKLEEYSLRLALLYFLVDNAWEHHLPAFIPTEYVGAGMRTAEWFLTENLRVQAVLHQTGAEAQRYKDIVTWAREKCAPGAPLEAGFAARDILRSRLVADAVEAASVIEQMAEAGLVAEVKHKKSGPGRPGKRFLPVSFCDTIAQRDESDDE